MCDLVMVSRDGGICSVFFLWHLTVRLVCLMDGSCDAVDCDAWDTTVLIVVLVLVFLLLYV